VLTFRCNGTAIFNVRVSALDVFFSDDEWHDPVASEVGGMGAHACQLEFFTLAIITDAAGIPFTDDKMKFAAPTANDSKLYWHAFTMLRRWPPVPLLSVGSLDDKSQLHSMRCPCRTCPKTSLAASPASA